jgi:hypothetical protein
VVATTTLAARELGWRATHTLEDLVAGEWQARRRSRLDPLALPAPEPRALAALS